MAGLQSFTVPVQTAAVPLDAQPMRPLVTNALTGQPVGPGGAAPAPTYSTVLTHDAPYDAAREVQLTLASGYENWTFQFNAAPNGDLSGKDLNVYVNGQQVMLVNFPATYLTQNSAFRIDGGGSIYLGSFVDGTPTLTKYTATAS